MGNNSYQHWQCDKCDNMNPAAIYKCNNCGAPIPAIYYEESEMENPYNNEKEELIEEQDPRTIKESSRPSYQKKEKTIDELKKEFLSVWITVGNITIFCFIINVLIVIGLIIALANGSMRL